MLNLTAKTPCHVSILYRDAQLYGAPWELRGAVLNLEPHKQGGCCLIKDFSTMFSDEAPPRLPTRAEGGGGSRRCGADSGAHQGVPTSTRVAV